MKILIFENEFSFISTPFDYINELYFKNTIHYTVCSNSQDLNPFSKIQEFDYVFIDISLGKSSELDGFGILKKIETEKLVVKKVIILTGNHLIREVFKEREIFKEYDILTKPIDFNDLLARIKIE